MYFVYSPLFTLSTSCDKIHKISNNFQYLYVFLGTFHLLNVFIIFEISYAQYPQYLPKIHCSLPHYQQQHLRRVQNNAWKMLSDFLIIFHYQHCFLYRSCSWHHRDANHEDLIVVYFILSRHHDIITETRISDLILPIS